MNEDAVNDNPLEYLSNYLVLGLASLINLTSNLPADAMREGCAEGKGGGMDWSEGNSWWGSRYDIVPMMLPLGKILKSLPLEKAVIILVSHDVT